MYPGTLTRTSLLATRAIASQLRRSDGKVRLEPLLNFLSRGLTRDFAGLFSLSNHFRFPSRLNFLETAITQGLRIISRNGPSGDGFAVFWGITAVKDLIRELQHAER